MTSTNWLINGGSDGNHFSINSQGKLTFISAPNFELPTDIDQNNIYEVSISATDTLGNYSIQTVLITVTDASDYTIPLIDTDSDGINNISDLDDDNDGIIDATEMCSTKINLTGLTTGGNSITIGNNSVTLQKSTGATFSGDVNGNLKILISNSNLTYSNVYLNLSFTKPTVLELVHGSNSSFGNFDFGDIWELVSLGTEYSISDPNGDLIVSNNSSGVLNFGSLYPANSNNINES